MTTTAYDALCEYYGATPDRKGNVYVPCPGCGRGKQHFSFHPEFGGHCYACDYRASNRALVDTLGAAPASRPAPEPKPAKRKAWQKNANLLAESFANHPSVLAQWADYKPIPPFLIAERKLGYGVFPGLWHQEGTGEPRFVRDAQAWWLCDHPRLIVPLYCGGEVIGFRARSTTCSCPRWLSPGGSKLPLYNGAVLIENRSNAANYLLGDSPDRYVRGQKLIVCENPVDALWGQSQWGVLAVATMGVSIWKSSWTKLLLPAMPKHVLMMFDNDEPGHKFNVRRSKELGGVAYQWGDAKPKSDIGDLLAGGAPCPSFARTKPAAVGGVSELAQWFVTEWLGREWTPTDFRGSHMAHAKSLLVDYAARDVIGCLEAVRANLIEWDLDIQYLTLVRKGEPPLMSRYEQLKLDPPPRWKTDEYAAWKRITGNDGYADEEFPAYIPRPPMAFGVLQPTNSG